MQPRRTITVLAAMAPLILLTSTILSAQGTGQDWEGREVSGVIGVGFSRENERSHILSSGIKPRQPVTRALIDRAHKILWDSRQFSDVRIDIEPDKAAPGKVIVTLRVEEYPVVHAVVLEDLKALPKTGVQTGLRISPGETLNPFLLKQDRDYLRNQYLSKGYHFSVVQEEIQPGPAGVTLTWKVFEGPLVSVADIIFSGNLSFSTSDLMRVMNSKVNGTFLGIPSGTEPFVERILTEDIERLKLFYRMEGWLDIYSGQRIFLEDLIFTDDHQRAIIKIHIDEGERFGIRRVLFEFDGGGPRLFTEEEMRPWLLSQAGGNYSERDAGLDANRIRERFGEKAYILTEVNHEPVYDKESQQLDLIFKIKMNEKVHVGRLIIEGNHKTREDILRREITRMGFLPGEEFNRDKLNRGLNRIRDRQWVDSLDGIQVRTQEGDEPGTRDVILDVKEGQTGSVRFAAGYSSSYGILGILEFTQRNFDLADVPSGLDDLVSGTGFAGGGQFLRLRLAPAARRQTYSIDFKEPYVFGYDFGLGVRAYAVNTLRESYDEAKIGGALTLDKRLDPFVVQLTFNGYETDIDNVDPSAPLMVQQITGTNTIFSLIPALILDTRDSWFKPTQGFKFALSFEYAGQVLAGDFDFNKTTFDSEFHYPLYETENRLRHVFSTQFTVGHVRAARDLSDIPIFERYFAGGRDSIRGFQYRGMGPHELGDPIGGEGYVYGSVEYSYPIIGVADSTGRGKRDVLRGAFFYDVANLTLEPDDLRHEKWRNSAGFGLRFLIPQLGDIPVKLDFGFPFSKHDEDERQTVTFDIGTLF